MKEETPRLTGVVVVDDAEIHDHRNAAAFPHAVLHRTVMRGQDPEETDEVPLDVCERLCSGLRLLGLRLRCCFLLGLCLRDTCQGLSLGVRRFVRAVVRRIRVRNVRIRTVPTLEISLSWRSGTLDDLAIGDPGNEQVDEA